MSASNWKSLFVSGRCIDGINNFTCTCDAGYVGKTCDIDYDDCSSSPCDHGTNTFLCYTQLQKLFGNSRCHFYDTVIVSVSIKKKENRNPGSNPDLSYPNLFLSTTTLPHRPSKILKRLSTRTSKLLHQ